MSKLVVHSSIIICLRDFATRSRTWPALRRPSIIPSAYSTPESANTAARLVIKTKRWDHITPVLVELHWLSIRQPIAYKLLPLTFNSLHGLTAPYRAELLSRYRYQPVRYALLTLTCCRPAQQSLYTSTQDDRAFSHAEPFI